MRPRDLMIGDLVTFKDCLEDGPIMQIKIWQINADGGAFVFIDDSDALDEIDIDDEIVGIPITPEILSKNGWIEACGYWVLKGESVRLGWKDGKFILGYTELPNPVLYVHELQFIYKVAGIKKEIVI